MESEFASGPSPSKMEAKPKSHTKIIAVIAVAVIAIVIGAFLVTGLLSQPQGQSSWLFEGAYAKYEGTTSMNVLSMSISFSFTLRQEVVDFNSTHAQLLTSVSMDSSLTDSVENEVTVWVDLSENQYLIEEGTLVDSYEANLPFEGFGNRDCVVYKYTTDGPTLTIYVDKQIGWPLKMNVGMAGEDDLSLDLDINLVETNIPGLK
ncbi:MAG: hypothetical protein JSW44_04395 [Candidatus Bathyarchaeota archaeon]|nr:MAG: hypothetical protein JSW44_04395 [Candidatus Bathyarchaeota archaeon]